MATVNTACKQGSREVLREQRWQLLPARNNNIFHTDPPVGWSVSSRSDASQADDELHIYLMIDFHRILQLVVNKTNVRLQQISGPNTNIINHVLVYFRIELIIIFYNIFAGK